MAKKKHDEPMHHSESPFDMNAGVLVPDAPVETEVATEVATEVTKPIEVTKFTSEAAKAALIPDVGIDVVALQKLIINGAEFAAGNKYKVTQDFYEAHHRALKKV